MDVEYLGNKELLKLKNTAFLASNTILLKWCCSTMTWQWRCAVEESA